MSTKLLISELVKNLFTNDKAAFDKLEKDVNSMLEKASNSHLISALPYDIRMYVLSNTVERIPLARIQSLIKLNRKTIK